MTPTRRETLLGLVGMSTAASLGGYELTADSDSDSDSGGRTLSRSDIEGLLAVTDIVYPGDPRSFESLLTRYVGRLSDERTRRLYRTLSELDRVSYGQSGVPFRSLSPAEGRRLFESLGVNRVQSRACGTLAERVRFHLVNSVLFALLTDPNGTAPFGIENPVGYPGGLSSHTHHS